MSSNHPAPSPEQIISLLAAAVTNTRMYAPEHPLAAECIDSAYKRLSVLLDHADELTLFVAGRELVVQRVPVPSGSAYAEKMMHIMKQNGLGRLSFLHGVTYGQLQELIRHLAAAHGKISPPGPHIKIGSVQLCTRQNQEAVQRRLSDEEAAGLEALLAARDSGLDEIRALQLAARRGKSIDIRGIDTIIRSFIGGISTHGSPLRLLAEQKAADAYTFTHVVNVCILTMAQAAALGVDGDHLFQAGIAAALHDTGKIFIPDDIINKPARLTDKERAVIETHTIKGASYLMGNSRIPRLAVVGAMEHHMHYDGSGYPKARAARRPHIISQLIAIADVFDALRSRRAYSEPKTLDCIRGILTDEQGSTFNPKLVQNFLHLIERVA